MKKAFSILFLFVFLYNLVGYYIVFNMVQFQVKDEVKYLIKHFVPQEELVLISIENSKSYLLAWTKPNKEFRYQGQMFDIVEKQIKDNKIIYSCIHDFKESKLFENLDIHIKNYISHHPEQQNKTKNLLNIMAKLFFFQRNTLLLESHSRIKKINTIYIQNYQSIVLDLQYPPPQKELSIFFL
ncbi:MULTISPECIES: hypothetical protein [unclassified Lentimicrobium]|uniref:hypothetical protein n=1 Tax=unclassified Lentimicrobium TaxID=2677434 RepID=UPI0015569E49|nr:MULTISPECIES: hypothetical protein [unclassified Lentimicrobium]NPD45594.1 hypothetical protein [Lentimicrobium sp. S6]NPD86313.1 hypothetical protein [Lentimicrobium sp. L6]